MDKLVNYLESMLHENSLAFVNKLNFLGIPKKFIELLKINNIRNLYDYIERLHTPLDKINNTLRNTLRNRVVMILKCCDENKLAFNEYKDFILDLFEKLKVKDYLEMKDYIYFSLDNFYKKLDAILNKKLTRVEMSEEIDVLFEDFKNARFNLNFAKECTGYINGKLLLFTRDNYPYLKLELLLSKGFKGYDYLFGKGRLFDTIVKLKNLTVEQKIYEDQLVTLVSYLFINNPDQMKHTLNAIKKGNVLTDATNNGLNLFVFFINSL
jgi:hypothetical protein